MTSKTAANGLPRHPATYSEELIPYLEKALHGCRRILDPMAGIGTLHTFGLSREVERVTVELQPLWAAHDPRTYVGNCLDLPFADSYFDGIVVSPPYGNRLADQYVDDTHRITYRHYYGAPLEADNGGALQWGPKYKDFCVKAWKEARRVLRSGGRFVLNISDHIRDGEAIPVTQWHAEALADLGFRLINSTPVQAPRNRNGANADLRVDFESVLTFVYGKSGQADHFGLSDSVEWYTPPELLEPCRAVLGEIDLDPASCDTANGFVKAKQYFGLFDFGLRREWFGKVFLNPPYGRYRGASNQALWSAKLVEEYDAGRVEEAILLVTAATSESWFKPLKERFAVCLVDGRVKFLDRDGKAKSGNTKGTALVYLGKDEASFKRRLSKVGTVIKAI